MTLDAILGRLTLHRFLIFVFILVLIGYTAFEAYDLWIGPNLTIISPTDGTLVPDELVIIEGETRNVSWISMLGRPITIDEQGKFREILLLPPGYSILTFEAKDRLGRTTTKTLSLIRPAIHATSSSASFIHTTTALSTSTPTTTVEDVTNSP